MATTLCVSKNDSLNGKVKLIANIDSSLSPFEQNVLKSFEGNGGNLQSSLIIGGALRKKLNLVKYFDVLKESFDKAGLKFIPGEQPYDFSIIVPAHMNKYINCMSRKLKDYFGYNIQEVPYAKDSEHT
ncbi:MAG: hypothetical protein ACE5KE_13385 [Methanosarcinales archaeon]